MKNYQTLTIMGLVLLFLLTSILPYPVPIVVAIILWTLAVVLYVKERRRRSTLQAKFKKATSAKFKISSFQKASDDTQFWVCPNCGKDIQMKDGRQYCSSCNAYLSR